MVSIIYYFLILRNNLRTYAFGTFRRQNLRRSLNVSKQVRLGSLSVLPRTVLKRVSPGYMKGFTLLEVLTTIAIFLLIAAGIIPIYGNLTASSQLDDSHSGILNALRVAREQSIARLNDSSHGVYFEINPSTADRYILYQGASYASRDVQYDLAISLDNAIVLSTTFPGNEVNFSGGFGRPNTIGTIAISHSVKGSKSISVNSFGIAE